MADVAIIHSADKEKAAARLVEAVRGAGFSVGAVEVADPSGLADAMGESPADARILIWSRALVSHALHSGELARIRQLRGLIEVSADGITPPSGGDELRVVSISGWRGQPFHPGWQRINAELRRLCGPRKAAPEAAVPAAPAREAPRERTAPATPSAGASPKRRRLLLGGGIAVALAAAAAGSLAWFGKDAPDATPRQALSGTSGPDSPGGTPGPRSGSDSEPPEASAAAPQVQDSASGPSVSTPREPAPEAPAAAEAKPEALPAKRTSPAARIEPPVRPKPRGLQSEAVKKYSRKNSKVMRQFCERSGRSTPQCRTFLRSVRGAGAGAD